LDNKVTELEDVVFKQYFKGIQNGMVSIVKAECAGDGAMGKIGTKGPQAMTGVNVGVHGNGVHGEETDGGGEVI
jgi:hypothetical protein